MVLLGEEVHQILNLRADGLVGNHIREIVNAVELLGCCIELRSHIVLELLGHPYDTLYTALGIDELLGRDEVTSVSHISGSLYAAAGAGG